MRTLQDIRTGNTKVSWMTHEFLDSLIDRYGDAAMVHTATLVASGNQPYSTWEIVLVLPSGNRIVVSGTVDSMGFAVVDK